MAGKALGMIEVRGLLGAIIAADIALKTADVHLVANQTIKGGLTSVELFGSVGAIKESVSAAREVVSKMGCFISSNIIANLDPQVENMILESLKKNKAAQKAKQRSARKNVQPRLKESEVVEVVQLNEDVDVQPTETSTKEAVVVEPKETPVAQDFDKIDASEIIKEYGIASFDELATLKVTQLRSIAYAMNLSSLTKKEIKFAKKADLMDAIVGEGAD